MNGFEIQVDGAWDHAGLGPSYTELLELVVRAQAELLQGLPLESVLSTLLSALVERTGSDFGVALFAPVKSEAADAASAGVEALERSRARAELISEGVAVSADVDPAGQASIVLRAVHPSGPPDVRDEFGEDPLRPAGQAWESLNRLARDVLSKPVTVAAPPVERPSLAASAGRAIVLLDDSSPLWATSRRGLGAALVIPFGDEGGTRGVVALARRQGHYDAALATRLEPLRVLVSRLVTLGGTIRSLPELVPSSTGRERGGLDELARRAKEERLAVISHELRTPMHAIIGMTELALETERDADRREILAVVQSNAESLLSLFDEALELTASTESERAGDGPTAAGPGQSDRVPVGHSTKGDSADAAESSATRVLVVEDHPDSQKLAEWILRQAGYEPFVADDAAGAMRLWDEREYDLVLTDLQMPGTDGIALARMIRERERLDQRPRTPIVALTACTVGDTRQRCFTAGMDDFLAKPARREELLAAVARWTTSGGVARGAAVVPTSGVQAPIPQASSPHASSASTPDRVRTRSGTIAAVSSDVVLVEADIVDLVEAFLLRSRGVVEGVEGLLANGDFLAIARDAHNLKGSGPAYGFERLGQLARELEQAARAEDASEVARLRDLLAAHLRDVRWGTSGQPGNFQPRRP